MDSIRREETEQGTELMKKRLQEIQSASSSSSSGGGDQDELFAEAGRFIIQKDKASIGMLQRMFKIGFNQPLHHCGMRALHIIRIKVKHVLEFCECKCNNYQFQLLS